MGSDGTVDHQEHKHGVVVRVTLDDVCVLESGTTNRILLPANFSSFKQPKQGAYALNTGEVIKPDYVTQWVVQHGEPATIENLVAHRSSATFSWYGIGTTIYGHADKRADGSYIATKWFTIFMLPIYPLASFRIYAHRPAAAFSYGAATHRSQTVPLHEKQVASTYIRTYSTLILTLLGLYLLSRVIERKARADRPSHLVRIGLNSSFSNL
jgi:hypothetical protein